MCEAEVEIINKLGLHARAALKFVELSLKHSSQVTVAREGREVNGKSILGLMTLAARSGTILSIETVGEDEKELLDALRTLVSNKFGESA
tara:strand:- start:4448 stop:4717 length:270 start_codon:yes stop_codon:yes gene_type:complete